LHPYFFQNKYAPYTYNSRPPEDEQRPGGHAPQLGKLCLILRTPAVMNSL